MANYIVCLVIQRFILPLILASCVLFRPVGLSLPYLWFLFYLPHIPVATKKSMRGHTGYFFKFLIAISVLILLAPISFQILLAVLGNDFITKCEFLEILLRHVGVVRFDDLSIPMIVLWSYPEVVMFLASIIIFILLKKFSAESDVTNEIYLASIQLQAISVESGSVPAADNTQVLKHVARVLSVIALCVTGSLQPSVLSLVYFIVFLGAATWYACNKELERAYSIVLRITLFFLMVHITGFLAYQTPWPQQFLPVNTTIPRLLGFTPLVMSACDETFGNITGTDIRVIDYNLSLNIDYYLLPVVLIICYYVLTISAKEIASKVVEKNIDDISELESGRKPSVPLVKPPSIATLKAAVAAKKKLDSKIAAEAKAAEAAKKPLSARQVSFRMHRKNLLRKTMSSSRWRGAAMKVKAHFNIAHIDSGMESPTETSPLMRSKTIRKKKDPLENETEDEAKEMEPTVPEVEKPKLLQRIADAAVNTAKFIYQNSYIFTNMTMMMWSIIYHSWIGFVFLIWSNVIWIVPNQRKNMLKCTPYIVFYAECLLLAQFLFGMNLTEDELPSSVSIKGINILDQLGFRKQIEYAFRPLLLKSVFTVMFWASCRQYMSEREIEKGQSALGNMMVNQQITVLVKPNAKKGLLAKIGVLVNAILVKFWIWAVVLTLFMSGFSGSKMTVFRILYMALFLIFALYFQFSWTLWRKTMYAFWLVVIVYSMIILILVYIYQFKQFPEFCVEYLRIPLGIQKDIGLEVYATKQLLLHLITPTAVVIITVVQLHYCHTKFLEWSEIPPRAVPGENENPLSETSSAYGTFSAPKMNDGSENDTSELLEDIKFRRFSKKEIIAFLQKVKLKIIELFEFILVIIEMHALKGILIFAFFIGVRRVNLVHMSFVILCVVGVRLKTEGQIYVAKLISLISAIILIITMVYQVEYIDKKNYETDCGNNNTDVKYLNNTAEWFGLDKQNKQTKLMGLIKFYFLYIVIVSCHTVLVVRQTIRRIKAGLSPRTPLVLFPKVVRRDADKDFPHFFMYLANYAFYKFGLEICLVGMVVVVATRMDFFACFYAIWLCKLYNLSRAETVEQWPKLKRFIITMIPIQYVLLVGLPPLLCLDYPWNIPFLKDFREWAMMPENTNEFRNLHWRKLIVDFILLLMICRQTLVFRIEERYKDNDDNFPGGTNKSVLKYIDQMGIVPFENPTPDFIERIRNWLDIAKRGFFMIFFWLTLSIVFITGSSRVNIFSVGYLIGAFTFLWEGTDFYLRPIDVIIKRWNYLIGYNCIAIACKASLQMFGCLFLGFLTEYACFIVQLLGISCVCAPDKEHDEDCTVAVSDGRLFLDGICFAILLLQKRVFASYYFCHVINETKASAVLASRGAELLDELALKDVKLEQEHEMQVLQKIKSKMDRIKATQQKILESIHDQRTHHEGVSMSGRRPSMSSCAGYHTPIEDEVAASVMVEGEVSDLPSDINGGRGLSRNSSYFPTQAPSPCSAILTISEGYLEPFEISYSMPPDSELIRTMSPEETFPVFSPPPYDYFQTPTFSQIPTMQTLTAGNLTPASNILLNSTSEITRKHRRQSSLNTVSWQQDQRELTVEVTTRRRRSSTNILPLPNTLAPEATPEECHSQISKPRTPRTQRRPSCRRLSSVGMTYMPDELTVDYQRRRPSYAPSWAEDDDEVSNTSYRRRKSSWGPVGEIAYQNSLYLVPPKSPTSHHQSIRSGDYYMFEEVEDEFELEIIDTKAQEEEEERQSTTRRRLSKKTSFGQLLTKMKESSEKERLEEVKRQNAMRRVSEPIFDIDNTNSLVQEKTIRSEPIRRHTQHESGKNRSESASAGHRRSKPGTSKDSRDSSPGSDENESLIDGPPAGPTPLDKIKSLLKMGPAFISSLLVSLTIRLHRLSKSYRYVMKILSKEKKALKEQPGFGAGTRTGPNMIWTPIPSNVRASSSNDVEGDDDTDNKSTVSIDSDTQSCAEIQNIDTPGGGTPVASPAGQRKGILAGTLMAQKGYRDDMRKQSIVPEIRILAPSIERGLDVMSPLNRSAEYLDRKPEEKAVEFEPVKPKKVFADDPDFASQEHSILTELLQSLWYSIVAHTDLICFTMVFVNQINSSSILSLPLPLMVFLWGSLTFPRPSKTFWVTLIAYTQIIVIIKCVCQYEVLWWNQGAIPSNKPFAPPRILGIESKKGYANYDLALLLFLFCHRFILKSLGLWKTEVVEEVLQDGPYTVESSDDKTKDLINTADDEEMRGIEQLIEEFVTKMDNGEASADAAETNEEDVYVNMVQDGEVKHRFQTTIRLSKFSRFSSVDLNSKKLLSRSSSSFYVFLDDKPKILHRAKQEVEELENGEKLQKIMQDDINISLKKVDSVTTLVEQPKNLVYVEKTEENTAKFFPGVIKLSVIKYASSVKEFISQLIDNRDRKTADVYGFLFMCDFINFFVIIFGFSAFGTQEGDGGVMSYLEENKVPLPFLLMLIIQFMLIIIDRAIYLRKQTVGKILFQILMSLGIHVWMFFVLPATTERTFNATRPPIMYYLIKCYYFLLSAYQIRSGYPQRILGNFLTKGFGFINSTGYKIYMSVPFLFELRTLMDWIFTDTSMSFDDWLKMEDIFTNIYQLKCSRTLETDIPVPSGQKKKDMPKYIVGGTFLAAIIVAIWFPLALFAFSSAVGEPNIPHDFTMEIRIGPYDPIYYSGAQNNDIKPLIGQWSKFVAPYGKDKEALGFLGNYEDVDVAAARLPTNSSKMWNISPPDRVRFLKDLKEGNLITVKLNYAIYRVSHSKETPAEIFGDQKIDLEPNNPSRESLIKILYNDTTTQLHLSYMMPKFLKVRSNGFVKPIHPLTGGLETDDDKENYRNISLRLHTTEPDNVNETSSTVQYWWEVKEECSDSNYNKKFKDMPFNDCQENMVVYLFNDKLFPSTLSSLAAGGIIGIYSTFIFFFWRFLRGSIFSGTSLKIMFEDFPYVDRLLQLCLDIYLVRETMEFGLEEDLFAKLIFLYRSPETMIKWTRPKNESGGEDDSSRVTNSKKDGDDKKKD